MFCIRVSYKISKQLSIRVVVVRRRSEEMSFSIGNLLGLPTGAPTRATGATATSSTSAVSAASGHVASATSSATGANSAPRATRENDHVAKRDGQDSQLPGPSGVGLGPIFRPSVPPDVQRATVPSTISNSFVGPNFGQIAPPWWSPNLMWNPLLAMTMANPQQAQQPIASYPAYIPLSSSKGKGKRPPSPSKETSSSKKGRYFDAIDISSDDSEGSDDEEELAEPFDPSSFYNNTSKQPLPDSIEKYVDLHFRSCLSGSVRKAMGRETPLPNCQALRCLQADDTIRDFMDKDFPKKTDDRYKRMQSAVNASVAPALNLWRDLDEQGISASQGGLVPVDTVLDVLQRTVVLVGNASNYISQCRRDNVITKMEFRNKGLASVMKSVCKKHKPEGDLLFGSAVHKALTERAETVSALKKVATKIQEPAKSSHTPSGPNDKKFFRRSSALERGRGSGRIYRPQNRPRPQQFQRKNNIPASGGTHKSN